MSFLYKDKKDVKYDVSIKKNNNKVNLLFTADCGKFGTDEILDEFDFCIEELLQILQEWENVNY